MSEERKPEPLSRSTDGSASPDPSLSRSSRSPIMEPIHSLHSIHSIHSIDLGHESVERTLSHGDSTSSERIEEKHQAINKLFGFRPWEPKIVSLSEQEIELDKVQEREFIENSKRVYDYIWAIFFGWWLALSYTLLAGIMYATQIGKSYGDHCWQMQMYFFWPNGKYVCNYDPDMPEADPALTNSTEATKSTSLIGNRRKSKRLSKSLKQDTPYPTPSFAATILWYIFSSITIVPMHAIASACCWVIVVGMPMSRLNARAIRRVYKEPLLLRVYTEYPGPEAEVLWCIYKPFSMEFFKYSVYGLNIIFVNLFILVFASIFFAYIFPFFGFERPHFVIMFVACSVSILPISYAIGMAISSIAVQISFAAGAVLNASFGSFIELMLYSSALRLGNLNDLVQASITGTLLGMMLLLPGLSMVVGGVKYKEQRFNRVATGVSSVLLLLSVVGAFTPTIFYLTYGSYVLECQECAPLESGSMSLTCQICSWNEGNFDADVFYKTAVRPLAYITAIILPISYVIGVFFTLKSHADVIAQYYEEGGGHEAPDWNRVTCILVLLVCAVLFGLISEALVHSISPVLDLLGFTPRFAGLTFVALITSTIEFLNAILFSYHNQLSLAFEIANSYCVQVALIQMPGLVFISGLLSMGGMPVTWTSIFPTLDLFAVILGLFILNYVWAEGKSNYFVGSALIMIYFLFISAFYFAPTKLVEGVEHAPGHH